MWPGASSAPPLGASRYGGLYSLRSRCRVSRSTAAYRSDRFGACAAALWRGKRSLHTKAATLQTLTPRCTTSRGDRESADLPVPRLRSNKIKLRGVPPPTLGKKEAFRGTALERVVGPRHVNGHALRTASRYTDELVKPPVGAG